MNIHNIAIGLHNKSPSIPMAQVNAAKLFHGQVPQKFYGLRKYNQLF